MSGQEQSSTSRRRRQAELLRCGRAQLEQYRLFVLEAADLSPADDPHRVQLKKLSEGFKAVIAGTNRIRQRLAAESRECA